ncbi:hypothetical protein [Flavobacterium restrictum]|uniref:hypothetical protein n=1 Tax=Flavobacterium restrictum TaxID=2594428 RepID=UPI00163D5667|nr:hypothetical protein [Flavobacterium restrictum]
MFLLHNSNFVKAYKYNYNWKELQDEPKSLGYALNISCWNSNPESFREANCANKRE